MNWKDKFFFACMTLGLLFILFILLGPTLREWYQDAFRPPFDPDKYLDDGCIIHKAYAEKVGYGEWILTFEERRSSGWTRKWSATNAVSCIKWHEYPSLHEIKNEYKIKLLQNYHAQLKFMKNTGRNDFDIEIIKPKVKQ